MEVMSEKPRPGRRKLKLLIGGRRANRTWVEHSRKQCSKGEDLKSGTLKGEGLTRQKLEKARA